MSIPFSRSLLVALGLFGSARSLDLSGVLVDAKGLPLELATIVVTGASGPAWTSTRTDGTWAFSDSGTTGVGTRPNRDKSGSAGLLDPTHLQWRSRDRDVIGRRLGSSTPTAAKGKDVQVVGLRTAANQPDSLEVWFPWLFRRLAIPLRSRDQGNLGRIVLDTSTARDSMDWSSKFQRPRELGRYTYVQQDSSGLVSPIATVLRTTRVTYVHGALSDSLGGVVAKIRVEKSAPTDSVRSDSTFVSDAPDWLDNFHAFGGFPRVVDRDTLVEIGGKLMHLHKIRQGYSTSIANGRDISLVSTRYGSLLTLRTLCVFSCSSKGVVDIRMTSIDGVEIDAAHLERILERL